ncbi:MAG: aconitase X catalytic domain-containing protein [Clostridia bacterium]|nr:aconitase X catalytic domain-containing protein [Clostridia bacterium]
MKLTQKEQEMLNGTCGPGMQAAMEVVVKMGELYGAERLLPVRNAHIDAAAYTTIWEAGTDFLEYLVACGARVAVPTTINPVSRDIENWRNLGISEEFAMKSKRIEAAYLALGVIPTWTCAPYQCTNVPRYGEIVSWSESNAVNYVNSVIGARAERLPDLMDVCCAVTGRVPAYGMYLDENRKGELLFVLEGFDDSWFRDAVDYAVLGYHVGEIAVNRVPVIAGLPAGTTADQLKAFSAAAASGGAICLFHALGLTPEATSLEAVCPDPQTVETHRVTPDDLRATRKRLDTAAGEHVDMVLLGCPHLSADELGQLARLLQDQKVAAGTELWLMTSDTQYQLARRAGNAQILEEAGALITRDTCLMEIDEGNGRWRGKTLVTNSGKAAQYAPAINGVRIHMAAMEGCVRAAVTGVIPGRR